MRPPEGWLEYSATGVLAKRPSSFRIRLKFRTFLIGGFRSPTEPSLETKVSWAGRMDSSFTQIESGPIIPSPGGFFGREAEPVYRKMFCNLYAVPKPQMQLGTLMHWGAVVRSVIQKIGRDRNRDLAQTRQKPGNPLPAVVEHDEQVNLSVHDIPPARPYTPAARESATRTLQP